MQGELEEKYQRLKAAIAVHERVIIAFSGGVDSSLVAYVAAETLGNQALAVTSGSKSLKRSDLRLATELAGKWGMQHEVIVTDELSKPDYRANPVDRCFHCKTSLYDALDAMARDRGYRRVLNGTNCDDLGDHRPGLIAAEEHGVASPLVEAGFCKADIRALAAELGLDNAAKPQAACLSSRFPYGSHITEERLEQVERAENVLAELGESEADMGVLFVGDGRMRRLNREYRRKDRTTDVLAFAQRDASAPAIRRATPRLLGDVVISVPTAMAQAREGRRSVDEELVALLVHGILHLCGYDHERSEMEARRMLRREKMVRRKLGSVARLVCVRSRGL